MCLMHDVLKYVEFAFLNFACFLTFQPTKKKKKNEKSCFVETTKQSRNIANSWKFFHFVIQS